MVLSPYDQSVYDAGYKYIPQSQYLLNPFQIPQGTENEVPAGIPAVYQPQVSSGGVGEGSYTGGINDLIQNYTTTTRDKYFGSQPTPLVDSLYQSKLDKSFLGMPSYQQQQLTGPDLGEYIGTDTDVPLELTTAGKIQNTLGNIGNTVSGIMSKVRNFGPVSMVLGSMDKFDTLSPTDQEFIKMNMGYTGPTVFGENTSGLSKDPYGINTRSAFGNYADYVSDKVAEYADIDEEEFDTLSDFRKTKINFYRQKQKEYKQLQKQMELEAELERQRQIEIQRQKEIQRQRQIEIEAEQARRARELNPEVYQNRQERDGTPSFGDQTAEERAYGSCFIAGTKVTMADGTFKNIEDIKVGDKVKGHKGDNEVIKLDPTLLGNRKLYSFNDNEHYFFTSEHPFMTEEGWKSIKPEKTKERDGVELYEQLKGELKVGDKLVTDNGLIKITDIKSKEMNNTEIPLYNFNVSNDNSYIADNYVVHNKGGGGGGGGSPGSEGPGGSNEMGSFAYGGRVPYMMGGLADLVDIYD